MTTEHSTCPPDCERSCDDCSKVLTHEEFLGLAEGLYYSADLTCQQHNQLINYSHRFQELEEPSSFAFMFIVGGGPQLTRAKVMEGKDAEKAMVAFTDRTTGDQGMASARVFDGNHDDAFARAWAELLPSEGEGGDE